MHFTSKQVVIAIASVLAAACSGGKSGDSSKINGPATTYRGAFADKNSTGSMTVNVASTSVSQSFSLPTGVAAQASAGPAANGSLVLLSGATVSLGGSFVASSGALSLSGGGYTFTGTLASGAISGTVGGPNGSGQFSVQPSSSSSSGSEAKTYCGTYATNRDDGWFNLVTSSGGNVSGFVVATIGATSVGVIGTITGSALTATTQDGAPIQATLSSDGTTLTGSYLPVGTAAGLGTFQGSTASCMPGSATGLWTTNGPSGSGVILDQMHFAILLSGSSVTGSGGMNTSGSNVNGGLFTITSGAISSSTISITGPLGSNPDGNGGFYHGVLTFNGTFTTPTKMTGTLDYTGPRTVAGHPQPQTVMGVTLTRY